MAQASMHRARDPDVRPCIPGRIVVQERTRARRKAFHEIGARGRVSVTVWRDERPPRPYRLPMVLNWVSTRVMPRWSLIYLNLREK